MYWSSIPEFSNKTIQKMQDLIAKHKKDSRLNSLFVNPILKEDVFDILDQFCTVIYFPLENEENDGFNISLPVSYNKSQRENFVFINTEKHLDKQVFAAGHELGHIWKVADCIWDNSEDEPLPRTAENEEAAMNRFAAELLMPKGVFRRIAEEQFSNYLHSQKGVKWTDAVRVIANLMNEFCVPKQAVIRRLYEVRYAKEEVCSELWMGPAHIPTEEYQEMLKQTLRVYIEQGGYTRLTNRTKKKWIKGFPELLEKLKDSDSYSKEKVDFLKDEFDLKQDIPEGTPEISINLGND